MRLFRVDHFSRKKVQLGIPPVHYRPPKRSGARRQCVGDIRTEELCRKDVYCCFSCHDERTTFTKTSHQRRTRTNSLPAQQPRLEQFLIYREFSTQRAHSCPTSCPSHPPSPFTCPATNVPLTSPVKTPPPPSTTSVSTSPYLDSPLRRRGKGVGLVNRGVSDDRVVEELTIRDDAIGAVSWRKVSFIYRSLSPLTGVRDLLPRETGITWRERTTWPVWIIWIREEL